MGFLRKIFYVLAAFSAFSANAMGQDAPSLGLPISCTPAEDCWILNYADTGPAGDGKAVDPACLSRTYEAHKGTDFAITDEIAMNKGVNTLAAMDGTVARVRDGEPDRWATDKELEDTRIAKKECGNAVLVEHADGWQTMYCHMKKGSIVVKPKQKIKRGDKIGQVGLSGLTQFPHLHFGLIHKAKVIDPFSGHDIDLPCDPSSSLKSLWDESTSLKYEPVAFFAAGFENKILALEDFDRKMTLTNALSRHDENLLSYIIILGAREGDIVDFRITSPDGKIFAQTKRTQSKTRARQLYYTGRKNNGEGFMRGIYTGHVTLTRSGADGKNQSFTKDFSATID